MVISVAEIGFFFFFLMYAVSSSSVSFNFLQCLERGLENWQVSIGDQLQCTFRVFKFLF